MAGAANESHRSGQSSSTSDSSSSSDSSDSSSSGSGSSRASCTDCIGATAAAPPHRDAPRRQSQGLECDQEGTEEEGPELEEEGAIVSLSSDLLANSAGAAQLSLRLEEAMRVHLEGSMCPLVRNGEAQWRPLSLVEEVAWGVLQRARAWGVSWEEGQAQALPQALPQAQAQALPPQRQAASAGAAVVPAAQGVEWHKSRCSSSVASSSLSRISSTLRESIEGSRAAGQGQGQQRPALHRPQQHERGSSRARGRAGALPPRAGTLLGGPAPWLPVWLEGGVLATCPIGHCPPPLSVVYAVASRQGRRASQEDRWVAVPCLHTLCNSSSSSSSSSARAVALFGVFDGHQGAQTSQALTQRLPLALGAALLPLLQEQELGQEQGQGQCDIAAAGGGGSGSGGGGGGGGCPPAWSAALLRASLTLDSELLGLSGSGDCSGSTACCVLILGGAAPPAPRTLLCFNLGDSRAVLCRGGAAVELSVPHLAAAPSERARILAAGGRIIKHRINGVLAVSRAYGDAEHKAAGCSAEPGVRMGRLGGEDEFVLLASDGLWDVLTSQQAVSMVRRLLCESGGDAGYAARVAAERAVEGGSVDNVSVCVCVL